MARHRHDWTDWEEATGTWYPGVMYRECECDGTCPESQDETIIRAGDGAGTVDVYRYSWDEGSYYAILTEHRLTEEYGINIGNVQGGWRETTKFKDKKGNWVTRTVWGSGKAGW